MGIDHLMQKRTQEVVNVFRKERFRLLALTEARLKGSARRIGGWNLRV